jgi:hypothetical protein
MSVRLSPNLPANVVEIGVEISQAKLDAINNGSAPAAGNPFTTVSYITGLSYATQSWVTSQGYLTDAPSNGNEYVRKNGAWSIATGGGGGGGGVWGSITGTITDQTDLVTLLGGYYPLSNPYGFISSSGLSVTNIDLTGNFNGYSMGSGYYSFKYDSSANTLRMQDGTGFGVTLNKYGVSKNINTYNSSGTIGSQDENSIVFINGTMISMNLPDDATWAFPVGTIITIVTSDATSVNYISTTGSSTINGSGMTSITLIKNVYLAVKTAADTWYVS